MDVVCTAGHVDHGKSALVRALTGMEPDRFDEEQRRGLTIDLGFAWARIGAGEAARTIAFVDLPGHERFIGNMLAGAGPVEVALFVVAADEGWKPQSQEHLDILDLLDVEAGVVALTKTDLVDDGRTEAIRASVAGHLRGTTLAGAEIVPVSAVSGSGLDDLTGALLRVLAGRRRPMDRGLPRLWVDRCFTARGAGTVVTGTLTGGSLHVGDAVRVEPGGVVARVRGLQSLKSPIEIAEPGDRVAVNLAGVDLSQITRGHVVAHVEGAATTTSVDVRLRALDGHELGGRGAWHLHAGSGVWTVRIRPIPAGAITGEGFARIELDRPAPLTVADRFVLRDTGRRRTAGGGIVLDADPPRLRGRADREKRAQQLGRRQEALSRGDRDAVLLLHVSERGVALRAASAAAAGLPPEAAARAAVAGRLSEVGGCWAAPQTVEGWADAVTSALRRYHTDHPLEATAPRSVAQAAAIAGGAPAQLAADVVTLLTDAGRIAADGPGVRLPEHGVRLSAEDMRRRDLLLALLDERPFAPPRLADAATQAGAPPALVRELESSGQIVRLTPEIAVSASALHEAADRLRGLGSAGPFTAAQAKENLGTTRKYAVPLLEELDRRGITRRDGDVRHVRQ